MKDIEEEKFASEQEETVEVEANAAATESKETEESGENSENAEEAKEPTIEEQLTAAQEKIAELNDKYLRLMAEFDNYRKRVMKEKSDLIKTAGTRVITTILPIIDDMERAEQNMDQVEDVASLKEGLLLIFDKFMKLMATEGLKKIDTTDKVFDTDYHEAVAMIPGQPDELKGKVIDCIQTGYTLNDKVIRHAKVAVAQ